MKKKKEELSDAEVEKMLDEHFKKPKTPIPVLIIDFFVAVITVIFTLGIYYVIYKLTGLFFLSYTFAGFTFLGIAMLIGPLIVEINDKWK